MSRSFNPFWLVGGTAVAAIAIALHPAPAASDDHPTVLKPATNAVSSKDPRLEGLARGLDALSQRQDDLEDELDAQLEATPAPLPGPTTADEVEASQQAFVEELEGRLAAEGTDPSWAPAAEAQLHDWLTDFHGAQLQSATCGSSLCRLVVAYPDLASKDAGMAAMPLSEPWSAPGFARPTSPDLLEYEVFIARSGHALEG